MYFGGAGYYFGKQTDEMLNTSYGVLFKNGEAIEIDPECTTIYALAVSSDSHALQETENMPLEVYPNPTNGTVTIDGLEVAEVKVYNFLGQLVKETKENVIDLSAQEAGTYILKVITPSGVVTKQIIKK